MPSPSKNPSKTTNRATKRAVATAAGWKKSGGGVGEVELELPSGNTILSKRPGLAELLSAGILPDMLTSIATDQITAAKGKSKGKKPDAPTFDEIMKDKGLEGVAEFLSAFDRICSHVVVEPRLLWHRRVVDEDAEVEEFEDIPVDERETVEVVYTDEVDMNDKIYIGQWAMGGQANLASFREDIGQSVEDSLPV